MSDPLEDPNLDDSVASWVEIGDGITAGVSKHLTAEGVSDIISNAILKALHVALDGIFDAVKPMAGKAGKALTELEEPILPLFAAFMTPIVASMFGSDAAGDMFNSRDNRGAREDASRELVDAFLQSVAGDGVDLSDDGYDGAKRIATAGVHAAIEGWFQSWILEMLGECVPIDWLHFTEMTKLPEDVIRALGIGRLVRRALTPLVNATAATPATWATAKQFRQKLLAESTALRQFVRGRWSWDDVSEELARQGYTDDRMDALLNELAKFSSVDELWLLVKASQLSMADAVQRLQDAGWDSDGAAEQMDVQKLKQIQTFELEMADAAVTAYADGRIDDALLDAYTHGTTIDDQHGAQLRELAAAKRRLGEKFLSSAQVETAVMADVLNFADYRDALARENYNADAVNVLDILLRLKKQSATDAATHKANQAAEKAAAAKTKADAAAAKKAEIDQARQLKAQGSIAELEHAVITGLVPMDRLVQILSPQFTADTVAIYVADVTQKKAAFDALQQKKADAATRAANKGIPLATLEQAVYDGIIPIDKLATLLTKRGMSDADVAILSQVISAKKADLDAAKQKRAQADQRASAKKISLSRAEALVLLGHWTMAQYASLLASLDFDDAAIAGMVDLLQSKIDARAAAAKLRAGAGATAKDRGLSLEQFRKAVIAGTKTLDDFSAYLQSLNYTSDAIAVLRDELSADVDGAHAAQLRRQQGDTTGGAVAVKLSTAQKAARLGVITPAAYQARLVAGGYSDDDIALEMDLLVAEIAGAKGAAKKAGAAPPSPASKGLTLTQLADAVKRGAATIGEWQAAARAANLEPDAIETMTAELDDALAVKSDAKNAHDNVAAKLAEQGVTLTDLEQRVRAGSLTVVDLEAQLVGYGFTDVEAQLVGSLLEQELAAAQAA